MNKTTKYILRKLVGVIFLIMGVYFMIAHMQRTFPFELNVSVGTMLIWAYGGTFISGALIIAGFVNAFSGTAKKILNKLEVAHKD